MGFPRLPVSLSVCACSVALGKIFWDIAQKTHIMFVISHPDSVITTVLTTVKKNYQKLGHEIYLGVWETLKPHFQMNTYPQQSKNYVV